MGDDCNETYEVLAWCKGPSEQQLGLDDLFRLKWRRVQVMGGKMHY
jgi:hypothetical protein